jgi:hypothetical protein
MFTKSYQKYVMAGVLAAVAAGLLVVPSAEAATGQAAHGRHEHKQHAHHLRPLDWAVEIPHIGVAAPVIELGGPRSGAIAVPTFAQVGDVGWYRYGAIPGQRGNAVLLGHVDTYQGPAVFYNLYQLLPGDQVAVDLSRHDIQRFTVRWVKEVLKSHFPAGKVFGYSRGRHLWLVTCGGQFNYVTRSYLSNIIVYTTADVHHTRHHHPDYRKPVKPVKPRRAASGPAVTPGATLPARPAQSGPAKDSHAERSGKDSAKPAAKTAARASEAGSGDVAPPGDVPPSSAAALVPVSRLVPPIVSG